MPPPLYFEDYQNGIYCIDVYYQRPRMAACYLVRGGDEVAFVDTGTTNGVTQACALMEHLGIAPEQVRYVMPTHVHLDHAGGAGRMMSLFPEAKLVVHPFGAQHMVDPTKLQAGTIAVYGEEKFKALYGSVVPIAEERVIVMEEGSRFDLGGRELRCLDTPGHARHHYCVVDAEGEGLFSGDTFGLGYPELQSEKGAFIMPTTTPVQFDPAAWHATLDRIVELAPAFVYLTHFGRVDRVPQLADRLRRGIDAHVAIALQAEREGAEEAWLKQEIAAWFRGAAQAHGCRLDVQALDELLAADVELNAQGLKVWLSRRARGQ